jgi:hypothetical protein
VTPVPRLAAALAVAWGALVSVPLLVRARRVEVAGRLASLTAASSPPSRRAPEWVARTATSVRRLLLATGPVWRVAAALAARAGSRRAGDALSRELPVTVDLLAVAVGAGCTPYLAVEVAAHWAPPVSAAACERVLHACALGASFEDALDGAARAQPRLRPLADALLVSDRTGAPVGPALARLATEERAALRRRAEAHARRVPVRLLFPLVFLVLPAFVLLTVVPGLAAGLSRL